MSCLRAAARERDQNLRQLRSLRNTPGSDATCAELTRRNGALTGAVVTGANALRAAVAGDEPSLA